MKINSEPGEGILEAVERGVSSNADRSGEMEG